MVQSFFDKEYFADGLRNKRIFFRFVTLVRHNSYMMIDNHICSMNVIYWKRSSVIRHNYPPFLQLTWQACTVCLAYKYLFRGVRNSFIYFQPSESDALDRWVESGDLLGVIRSWFVEPLLGTATGSSSLRWAPATSWCWARTSPRVTPSAGLTGGWDPTLHSARGPPEVTFREPFSYYHSYIHYIIIFRPPLSDSDLLSLRDIHVSVRWI